MPTEIITGKYAYVNGIPCTTKWGYNRVGTNIKYSASCTGGGTSITQGNINESGSMSGIGGNPGIIPGNDYAFKGVADNTGGDAIAYDGTIRPNSLNIVLPKESGGLIEWTAGFGVQGQLTQGTTGAADSSYALHQGGSLIADPILYDSGANYTIPGFRQANFTLTTPEKTFVTNGLTYRSTGNIEGTLSLDVYARKLRNAKYDVNVIDKLKLFVDATTFWFFEWVRFTGLNNFVVDTQTQALVGYTINAEWCATNGSALGHITKPDTTYLFGS